MPKILEFVDLFPYNTFRLHATARYFTIVRSTEEAKEVFASPLLQSQPLLILGGGSNMLLTSDFPGLVVRNEIKGIDQLRADDQSVTLRVGAGESWHDLVTYCVGNDFGGIENLSLIPGTCGAAPMQNIGAYGVEIKDVIDSVDAIEIATGKEKTFSASECRFGYRESIFKQEGKGKYFISSITLTLTKNHHRFNTSYGAIQEVLQARGIAVPNVKAISEAVITIRQSKLPDPRVIGNAGSFFKNPSIDPSDFERLKHHHPSIPSFPGEGNKIKVPAGWLIEQAGWKGKTLGAVGVHKLQALVLVNYGEGKGKEILSLSKAIQQSVRERFDISLQAEVNII